MASQRKFNRPSAPPKRTLAGRNHQGCAVFWTIEKTAVPAEATATMRTVFPATPLRMASTACFRSSVSSVVLVVLVVLVKGFLASFGIEKEISEPRRDADEEKNSSEPGGSSKPRIQLEPDIQPDHRGEHQGQAHRAQHTDQANKLTVFFIHRGKSRRWEGKKVGS